MRRRVVAYGHYYKEFLATLTEKEIQKVKYVLSLLETDDRVPVKFIKSIRDGLYELRIEYNSNIYRIFFIFDEGKIVVLFNGFQKKTQKTPKSEIPAALAELRKPKQERQPQNTSSKQTLSEISKTIQGHQRQLTEEEKVTLQASIDNRYQERAVANGSLMMCEVQGAKEDFIRRWNTIFKEYPDVFEDSDCRKIIHDLTEDAVQYLLKIKEKTL